jgi:GT2 family glycosyltransferase
MITPNEPVPIAVLYYNKVELTSRCIKSILDSGYSPAHVFCFSNGSKNAFHVEIQKRFPCLQHLGTSQNRGFSGGFNDTLTGVFSTGADSVLFCTNDTTVTCHAAEACEMTARETGADLVAPCITYQNHPSRIDSIGAYFDPVRCVLSHYRDRNLPIILNGENDYIPGTALWINRRAFNVLGGVDERFHTYWEDVDLCFRARKQGLIMARSYDAHILHGVGRTCHKKPVYTTFYFQRNRIRFCRSVMTPGQWLEAKSRIEKDLDQLRKRCELKQDLTRLGFLDKLRDELI